MLRTNDHTCLDILALLTSPDIQITQFLKSYFYKEITNTVIRDILTTPTELYYNNSDFFNEHINVNISVLAMPDGIFFNSCSKNISTVFNTAGLVSSFMKIEQSLLNGTKYASLNIPLLSECLYYIGTNAIKTTAVLEGMYEFNNNFYCYAQIPLTYQLYYPSIPSEMQSTISMEITQLNFDPLANQSHLKENENSKNIIINHSVADFFGLERSIFALHYNIFEEISGLELRMFIPGCIFQRGIIGGDFSSSLNKNTAFSFKDFILNIIDPLTEKNSGSCETLLLNSADSLVAATYGNAFKNKSFALSPSLQVHFPLSFSMYINGYFSYIYNFPYQKIAFGYTPINKKNYDLSYETTNEKEACQILSFFDAEFINRIQLEPFPSRFFDGSELQGSISIQTVTSTESIILGLDLWHKKKSIVQPLNKVDLFFSESAAATQINLFSSLELFKNTACHAFTIQFLIQASLYSSGIGKDFGGKIQLEYFY